MKSSDLYIKRRDVLPGSLFRSSRPGPSKLFLVLAVELKTEMATLTYVIAETSMPPRIAAYTGRIDDHVWSSCDLVWCPTSDKDPQCQEKE